MKTSLYSLIACFMLFFSVQSCSESESNTADTNLPDKDTTAMKTEPSDPVPMVVMNPNLATEEEMTSLSLISADLAKEIVAKRPFADIMDFDSLLSPTLNEDQIKELYVNLFIPVNLNTASKEVFQKVPGVGKKMNHEFREYRPYDAPARFRRKMAKYVEEKEIDRFELYVFVPVDLNKASDAHILSIPGMGERMLHEFKEYRPYKSIKQFNREIGKYVDDNELARLRRYVVIGEE